MPYTGKMTGYDWMNATTSMSQTAVSLGEQLADFSQKWNDFIYGKTDAEISTLLNGEVTETQVADIRYAVGGIKAMSDAMTANKTDLLKFN